MVVRERYKVFSKTKTFRVLLHVGFWVVYLTTPIVQYAGFTGFSNNFLLLTLAINLLFVVFYYPFAYLIVPRFFKWEKLLQFIIMTVAVYVAFFYSTKGIEALALKTIKFNEADQSYLRQSIGREIYYFPFLFQVIIITSIPLTLKVLRRYYGLQEEKIQLEQLNAQLELNFLRSQINPHFLFNTLNNIYSLSLQKSEQTPEMIIKLSDLMRYVLYECNVERISLEKEVAFMKDYVELEKLRYGKHVQIDFKVDGSLADKKTPPLLLIHFVENAFKHGVNAQIGQSFVKIYLATGEHSLRFRIENNKPLNGTELKAGSGGIGLENIKKRLQLIYPGNYQLQINNELDIFKVELTVNEL